MKPFSPVLLGVFALAVTLGVLIGLYSLLTRGRRRNLREIEAGATQRGWGYHRRRWQGDPTAFRIEGWTRRGWNWILKSGTNTGDDRGWTVKLGLRFPKLAGAMDVALFRRDLHDREFAFLNAGFSPGVQDKVARFSGTAADALEFFRAARELPSGVAAFDTTYQILGLPERFQQIPIDAALAERVLHWPADTSAPHSVVGWRDPFGLHFQARLHNTPNWTGITYLLALAEDLCARLPAPIPAPPPQGFLDRVLARFL